MSFFNLSTNLSLAAVLRIGGRMIASGELTIGSLTSFALQSAFVGLGFSGLAGFYADTMKALDAAGRVFAVMDRSVPRSRPAPPSPALPRQSAPISLVDVSYSYPSRPDTQILDQVRLTFLPQHLTVIVGKSGGGKSTLASLLCGLTAPTAGDIWYGAERLSAASQERFYALCGAAEQSGNNILSGTIFDNIAYGKVRPDALPVTCYLLFATCYLPCAGGGGGAVVGGCHRGGRARCVPRCERALLRRVVAPQVRHPSRQCWVHAVRRAVRAYRLGARLSAPATVSGPGRADRRSGRGLRAGSHPALAEVNSFLLAWPLWSRVALILVMC
jgi:hypothetical protein